MLISIRLDVGSPACSSWHNHNVFPLFQQVIDKYILRFVQLIKAELVPASDAVKKEPGNSSGKRYVPR
jgi:hypothetical protein